MVRIFLGTLLGSSAQVNCVLDKICLDKSPCLTFPYDFFWIRIFCMNFTEEKVASVSATVETLEVNLNSAEIQFVSRICERGVYEPFPEFQECMECLQVISR